ncbi:unnamed protein product [Didymodactylos carnosus]|uniref:Uncharacterized protein n=1 Tax=Didymodactylos carnosus TaxID=1234261 RepID=A0A814TDG7_9BILA|nr:unnamed protein product [Didymodactylos carnosus]CAF1156750.1 unnamed protein product [Didymodactylos carnosus]CAF3693949.1 unnamed protein product [Didymodactylos carnosus]CAF3920190.1 unnamed protein product [Didymodactylos carnosus]
MNSMRIISRAWKISAVIQPLRHGQISRAASSQASGAGSSHVVAGLGGGLIALSGVYAWYHLSGTREIVSTAKQTVDTLKAAKDSVMESTPSSQQAIDFLRTTVKSYAKLIPGAEAAVEATFDDLDRISKTQGKEIEKIMNDTYNEVKDVLKNGLTVDSGKKAVEILQKRLKEGQALAGDIGQKLLEKHPELKKQIGDSLGQLKSLAEKQGPEAKKALEDAYKQLQDITKDGISPKTVESTKKVVEQKINEMKKMGDQAWSRGMENAQKQLEKMPKAKKLLEDNADLLKSGNVQEIWQKIQKLDKDDVEKFLKETVDEAKQAYQKDSNKK